MGIQTLIELSKRLKPEKVKGQLVLVKVLNREDFEKRAGSISWEDGKNLNRVFPGKKDGTKMERLAAAITESLIRKADYYIDLHGGDDYEELTPYVYFAGVAKPEIVEASRKMAEQVDVPYMVQSNVSTGGAIIMRQVPAIFRLCFWKGDVWEPGSGRKWIPCAGMCGIFSAALGPTEESAPTAPIIL